MDSLSGQKAREALAGYIERVTFHNPDNGFSVLRIKARSHRDLVTVIGYAPTVTLGEFIQLTGSWVNDPTYGLQFQAASLRTLPPTTQEGIERYLNSGMIKGIGPIYGKKLVQAFGEAVFEVIEESPERLREIPGIGPKRTERIKTGWADQKAVREIMLFLYSHGVSTSRATRIFKTYGAEAIQRIRDNPYRLARDIRGIGFKTADAVAGRLGIQKTAMIRARAGIRYTLAVAMDEGHCGLPFEQLLSSAKGLLEIPRATVQAGLDQELEAGEVIADTLAGSQGVFLVGPYRAEQQISKRLRALAQAPLPWPVLDCHRAIPWIEAQAGQRLAEVQRQAVRRALDSKVVVITGGPGVGKTTVVNSILKILTAKGMRIALGAPTGRAAKRLGESTGLTAKTLHRLLEIDPVSGGFRRGPKNPLECEILVIDESSMVDVFLMRAVLEAVPDGAALLLVGDADQLPSVGPGQILADIIASTTTSVVHLTEVFRQVSRSRIVTNAHRINGGYMPEIPKGDPQADFHFVEVRENDTQDGILKILEIVGHRIPQRFGLDPIKEVQVLCPVNRGNLGAWALNQELQNILNPSPNPQIERFGWRYGVGDKVMQTENDHDKEVYNGDLGIVSQIDREEAELCLHFDGRKVTYEFDELDRVTLAYASTIHKSQGSEYPAVVLPLSTQHYPMLERRLVYTGVTRGKQLVVVVGQRKAMALAVRGVRSHPRWSKLKEWLTTSPPRLGIEEEGG